MWVDRLFLPRISVGVLVAGATVIWINLGRANAAAVEAHPVELAEIDPLAGFLNLANRIAPLHTDATAAGIELAVLDPDADQLGGDPVVRHMADQSQMPLPSGRRLRKKIQKTTF